jgi:hypothetical protein
VAEPDFYGEEFDVTLARDASTGVDEFVAIPHVLSFDQGFFHAIRAIEMVSASFPSFPSWLRRAFGQRLMCLRGRRAGACR